MLLKHLGKVLNNVDCYPIKGVGQIESFSNEENKTKLSYLPIYNIEKINSLSAVIVNDYYIVSLKELYRSNIFLGLFERNLLRYKFIKKQFKKSIAYFKNSL